MTLANEIVQTASLLKKDVLIWTAVKMYTNKKLTIQKAASFAKISVNEFQQIVNQNMA